MFAGYNTTKATKNSIKRLKHTQTTEEGFTLVELMVTVAIMGIVAAFAVPNVSRQIAEGRMKSTAMSLQNTLKEAKAESLIRRKNVTMEYTVATADTPAMWVLSTGIDADKKQFAQYPISDMAVLKPASPPSVTFKPSKSIIGNSSPSYIVCDSGLVGGTGITVTVAKLSNISVTREGDCS